MYRNLELSGVRNLLRQATTWAVGGLSVLFLVAGLAPPAHSIDCSPATSLSVEGYPQRAVAYVDGIRAGLAEDATPLCLDERTSAVAAVQKAQQLAFDAKRALAAGANADAKAKAEEAIAVDKENALATTVLATVAAPPGWWEQAAKGWEDFQASVVAPAGALALPAAVLLFALIVMARLLASLWPHWPEMTSAADARVRLAGGVVVTAAASGALVFLASGGLSVPDQPARGVVFCVFCVVAAVGVWLTARGLATRLRVAVIARRDGKEDVESAGQVLAYLEQFGAAPPQGIERPSGPDVQALANAFADVEGGLAKAVKSAVAAIAGWTPWQVVVDHCGEDQIAVAVSRNGRSYGAAIIGPDLLTVDGVDLKVDPRVFAASFVLTSLARAHSGFEGLCGTTDWVALGWQYVASTHRLTITDNEKAIPLLATSLGRDPGSWLAQVDLANRRWRFSNSVDDLAFYDAWLTRALEELPGYNPMIDWLAPNAGIAPLKLRMLLAQAATRINMLFARLENEPEPEQSELVATSISTLCLAIADAEEKFVTEHVRYEKGWLDTFKSRAAAMATMLTDEWLERRLGNNEPADRETVRAWDRLPRSPRAHYSRACALASPQLFGEGAWDRGKAPAVAAELREAVTDPEVADWLHRDPQMEAFRQSDSYHEFRPTPRVDLLCLKLFEKHRSALVRMKVDGPPALAATDPAALSRYLPVPDEVAVKLVESARAHESLRKDMWLAPLAVEATAVLLDRALTDPQVLAGLDEAERAQLSVSLADGTARFVASEPPLTLQGHFRAWLDEVHPHL